MTINAWQHSDIKRDTIVVRLNCCHACESSYYGCVFHAIWSHVMSLPESCHHVRWLQNKETGNVSYAQLDCLTWKCPKCSAKLRKTWSAHIGRVFQKETSGIWKFRVSESDWSTVHRRIRRCNGDYIRIRTLKGLIVYSNVPVSGSEKCCRHDAESMARRDVLSVKRPRKSISTSRSWKLPEKKPSKCLLISNARATVESVRKASAEFGVPIVEWKQTDDSPFQIGLEIKTKGWSDREIGNLITRSRELSKPVCPNAPLRKSDYSDTARNLTNKSYANHW